MTKHVDDASDYNEFDDENLKSRSQIKREIHQLQELGELLTQLPAAKLDSLNLPDELRNAIADYQRFTSRGAMKRQLQYIGKVMRSVDPEPIKQGLDLLKSKDSQQIAQFHRLEKWRDRLISEGDAALGKLVLEAPEIDRQHLRQMIRNAQKEAAQNKPPKNSRAIFQYLKDHLQLDEK